MRQVIGRKVFELDADKLHTRAGNYLRTVIDVGTGGGTAMMRRARRAPDAFFIGVDANAERMREASHRATRPQQRGGAPNTAFVAASAEELPGTLIGTADEVTVVLPWGSLMGGVLSADAQMVSRLVDLLQPGGRIEMLLSVVESDARPDSPPLDEQAIKALAGRYGELGLTVEEIRLAEESDIDRLGSSWGRRLGIPRQRQGWILALRT